MNNDIRKLNDNELDMISGGYGNNDDAQASGKCPYCSVMLKKSGKYFKCPECGNLFDKNGKEISQPNEMISDMVGQIASMIYIR